jgi:hypothetical protein
VQYTKILQKLGYKCTFMDFTIQNMVASCSVNFPIRLEGLAAHFEMYVHYEPEVFPGLVFRMSQPKVVLLIFVTGKIVITGAKQVTDIYDAFNNIYGVLQDHRKGDARRLMRTTTGAAAAATPVMALTGGSDAVCTRLSVSLLLPARGLSCVPATHNSPVWCTPLVESAKPVRCASSRRTG